LRIIQREGACRWCRVPHRLQLRTLGEFMSLQWELDWIDRNKHLYDSDKHAEAVKGNIKKRYYIRELEAEIANLNKR